MALIAIEDLTFAYESAAPALLDGITLAIAPGEKLALLGANGSGKSTLAQWIAGWLPRGTLSARAGTVRIEGAPWEALSPAARAGMVQFVGQVPMQQLSGFAFTVFDEIAFGPGNLGLPEAELRARVAAAMATCNLEALAGRDPFSLSGGEQQRLSIAAALAMRPRALVLDEPTGNFDPESREAFLAQMRLLPADLTTIWCDVALGPPLAIATRFVLLDGGRIAYDGDAAGLIALPRTREIFGLPAVAEAAAGLAAAGLWPAGVPWPATLAEAVAVLAPRLSVEGGR